MLLDNVTIICGGATGTTPIGVVGASFDADMVEFLDNKGEVDFGTEQKVDAVLQEAGEGVKSTYTGKNANISIMQIDKSFKYLKKLINDKE